MDQVCGIYKIIYPSNDKEWAKEIRMLKKLPNVVFEMLDKA